MNLIDLYASSINLHRYRLASLSEFVRNSFHVLLLLLLLLLLLMSKWRAQHEPFKRYQKSWID